MPLPAAVPILTGSWTGTSRLHLSWLPEDKRIEAGPSTLKLEVDASGTYATVTYTWTHEHETQQGQMMVTGEKEVKAAWADSWHQPSLMGMIGEATVRGFQVCGTYPTGDGSPDWGWRIEVEGNGDGLRLAMTNMPAGQEEEWAVEGLYLRDP